MISKTKLDESFLTSQFFMNGFSSPHRLDRNCNGGGILLYIREDIPSKLLSIERDLTKEFFLGDFNAGVEDTDIKIFCSSYNLTSMVNKATCYKNPDKSTCIDLILTNSPGSFQNSCVVETGLPDFHKMVVTVIKTSYQKSQPKIIPYRHYKNFSNDIFRDSLQKIFLQNL